MPAAMTSRQRIIAAMRNQQPDRVPVVPDLFEMVPVRHARRPSWDVLLFADPPIWKAQMDCAAFYGVDAFLTIHIPMPGNYKTAIVQRTADRIVARGFSEGDNGRRHWSADAVIYTPAEPSAWVRARDLGLPDDHDQFEVVEPVYNKKGLDYFDDVRAYVGERGVVAPCVGLPALSHREEEMLEYYQDPAAVEARMEQRGEDLVCQTATILSWKPDVLLVGNSGLMLFNPPATFRKLSLKWLQIVTKMARAAGVVTHFHCCGPERTLVEIAANETDLDSIEPLEIPPMGDCDLREIKREFGQRIALKGNLHTTDVMLRGTPQIVEDACKKAIDDAAAGGGFILSTGDQTPRDTPDPNIFKMVEVAQTYGRYA